MFASTAAIRIFMLSVMGMGRRACGCQRKGGGRGKAGKPVARPQYGIRMKLREEVPPMSSEFPPIESAPAAQAAVDGSNAPPFLGHYRTVTASEAHGGKQL